MNRILLAVVISAFGAQPAAADPGLAFLPQITGQRVVYRIAQSVQTANGTQTSSLTFNLVRRAGGTVVLERSSPNGAPNLSVLKTNGDGSLSLAEDPSGAAADADVASLLAGINLAIAATRADDASAHAPWTANVPVATTPNAETATISLVPANVAGNDFDFSGTGSPAPPSAGAAPGGPQRGRRGGSFPGGSFPGGGGIGGGAIGGGHGGPGAFPGGGTAGGRAPVNANRNGITYVVHVEGHVSGGRVRNIAITETRSVTVANVPFFNLASWTITVPN